MQGGVYFNATVPLTNMDEKMVMRVLQEYKIHNAYADILFREDATVDDFIDVMEGNRRYIKCLYVYNKVDMCCMEEGDEIARRPNSIPISCSANLNLDGLLERLWDMMALVRIYTRRVGAKPDFNEPVVLSEDRGGINIEAFVSQIHKTLVKEFNYALVWGRSAKHFPQRKKTQKYVLVAIVLHSLIAFSDAGLAWPHKLTDEDVVQIVKKKKTTEEDGKGRLRTQKNEPARIADRVKKSPMKT
ncbi:hypothetical protein BSKO_12577 [Bryopsis sp. KO-2023]|nr:hypothetical protein BSKO_12577 [Bryopsis sp. KO-2023]